MKLNLPNFDMQFRESVSGKTEVFDIFRKKWVRLTPEENVRQGFLYYLMMEKNFPESLIGVERKVIVNKRERRFDAVIFNRFGKPEILLEFKAPTVKLNQSAFDQIAAYNFALEAKFLMLSNGLTHYCVKIDHGNKKLLFLKNIPDYYEIR